MRPGHRRRVGQRRPRRHDRAAPAHRARPSSAAGSRSTTAARAATRRSPPRGSGHGPSSSARSVTTPSGRRHGPRSRRRGSTSPGCSTLADEATGVALIVVDEAGENSIAVAGGANAALDSVQVRAALKRLELRRGRTSSWSVTRSGPARPTRRCASAASPRRRRSSTRPPPTASSVRRSSWPTS